MKGTPCVMPEGPPGYASHLLVPWPSRTLVPKAPRSRGGSGGDAVNRSGSRTQHAARLAQELTSVQQIAYTADVSVPPTLRADGFAVRIEAAPGHELQTASLDKSGLSLMTVRPPTETQPQDAVVWVPDGAVPALLRKIDQFTENNVRTGRPKNNALVANIEQIEQATIKSLWQEEEPLPEPETEAWWELWLDPTLTDTDQVATLRSLVETHGWQMLPRTINIGHFRVAQVNATAHDLARILRTNACPSEIRKPTFAEDFHSRDLRPLHSDFVHDLRDRVRPAAPGAPTVTLLDTGIDQEHPLLRATIIGAHSIIIDESPDDNTGHGTQMGGLALFGDTLVQALDSASTVQLDHHLESVKILPRARNQHRPFGEVTAVAVSTAETAEPDQPRARVFTMAVTVESGEKINGTDGTATLWSASLDALAAGTDVIVTHDQLDLMGPPESDLSRLILVSAGNVRDHSPATLVNAEGVIDHLFLCDTSRIEDPAQAWNVITVGAHTELDHVPTDSLHEGYHPVAAPGLLSPHSRTSVLLPEATPIKPDIVMEGGILLIDADRTLVTGHDTVNLTTTDRSYGGRLLTSMGATSPATAQAARLAALAHARYPELRPEAIRGLDVSRPAHAAFATQAARLFRGAGYLAFDPSTPAVDLAGARAEHAAVASAYGHVTAPLRRLVDRFANEVVVAHCAGEEVPEWAAEALPELPRLMGSARQREGSASSRALDLVEALVLGSRLDGELIAVVVDLDDRGAQLQLEDPAVLLRVAGDGRQLGERVRLRVRAADPVARRVDVDVLGPA